MSLPVALPEVASTRSRQAVERTPDAKLYGTRRWCHDSRMLRTWVVVVLAASACSDWLGPELTVPPEDAGAAGSGGAPDECAARARASDVGALTIDFETMMGPRDRFQLGALSGDVRLSSTVAGTTRLFIRQGHGEASQRSLLLLLGELDSGSVGLHWATCLDVTARSGITFWAKGEASNVSVRPVFPGALPGPECVSPVVTAALTAEWQLYSYEWVAFCPNTAAPHAFLSKLTGFVFSTQATDTATEPWLALDDVSFTAGGG